MNDNELSVRLISHKPLDQNYVKVFINDDVPSSSTTIINNKSNDSIARKLSVTSLKRSLSRKKVITAVHLDDENSFQERSVILKSIKSNPECSKNVVEIKNLDKPPTNGLQVESKENEESPISLRSIKSHNESFKNLPSTSQKMTQSAYYYFSPTNSDVSVRHTRSVSVDPTPPSFQLSRNSARKSRFTDAFWNAKNRIDSGLEENNILFNSLKNRHSKIFLVPDTINTFIGIEVSAIPDPNNLNRIVAIEVMRIEDGGRVAQDGRLKVGDQIININGNSCNNMSLAKARLHLRELENISEPYLCFIRQIELTPQDSRSPQSIATKPIKSALQIANTSKVGNTLTLTITKANDGFGFSFAGRTNALNEHLFYIKTIKNNSACFGILKIGDRLLKIDEYNLSDLQQSDVTSILKMKKVGESIKLLISRITTDSLNNIDTLTISDKKAESESILILSTKNENEEDFFTNLVLREMSTELAKDGKKLLILNIPLNDSPSAGLGLSLMAQKIYNKEGIAVDSGLYIKGILHGSAAFKDGQLQVNDRLVAIERENLLKYRLNGEALKAFTTSLSQMPSTACSVRIIVARKTDDQPDNFNDYISVIEPSNSNSLIKDQEPTNFADETEINVLDSKDAFVRDTVIRKSISEKRPFGAYNDPSHLQTYQRIKHSRQTSASPNRRSLSIDATKRSSSDIKRERRSAATLDLTKAKDLTNQKNNLKNRLPTSISQPLLGDILKKSDESKISNLLPSKDKLQNLKSTGNGLLKLFQKSKSSAVQNEDEKDIMRYNNLVMEKNRLKFINDALCFQHGLTNNKDNSRLSASPNSIRRSNPPPYHQFLMNLNHSIAHSPDKYQIKHQRGHSAQEFSNNEFKEGSNNAFMRQHKQNSTREQHNKFRELSEGRGQAYFYTNNAMQYSYYLPSPPAYILAPPIPYHKMQSSLLDRYQARMFVEQPKNFIPQKTVQTLAGYSKEFTSNESTYSTKNTAGTVCGDHYDYNSFNSWFANSKTHSLLTEVRDSSYNVDYNRETSFKTKQQNFKSPIKKNSALTDCIEQFYESPKQTEQYKFYSCKQPVQLSDISFQKSEFNNEKAEFLSYQKKL